jgi:hypothetical protein
MAGGLARQQMTMRAVVQRNTTATSNPYGQPDPPTWVEQPAAIPCRVWSRARRHVVDVDRDKLVEDVRMIVPLGADLTELDRIARVEDRLGAVLWAGPLALEAPQHKHDHTEYSVLRVA